MKIVEVIVRKLLADFVPDIDKINPSDNVYHDLSLSENDMNIIRQRLQLIFNVIIPQDLFLSQSTYMQLCTFINDVYKQGANIENIKCN